MKRSAELKGSHKGILALSLPAAFLIIIVSLSGLLIPGTYFKETRNWAAQAMGQDIIDIALIVPVLLLSAFFAAGGNGRAMSIWGGTNLYLIYTFTIYCFNIHFNRLFIAYCLILGLAFYSFLYFVFLGFNHFAGNTYNKRVTTITAVYFFVIAFVFYTLWLAEIIPTIAAHTLPVNLIETGLTTNPVQVIDLSIILPGLFLAAILLLKKKLSGFVLAPALLVFCILMDITIGSLTLLIRATGIGVSFPVVYIMAALAFFSTFLLVLNLKCSNTLSDTNLSKEP